MISAATFPTLQAATLLKRVDKDSVREYIQENQEEIAHIEVQQEVFRSMGLYGQAAQMGLHIQARQNCILNCEDVLADRVPRSWYPLVLLKFIPDA